MRFKDYAFLLGCMICHWVLLYLVPVAPLDCPWSNSNAFNALNGEIIFNSYFQNDNNRFFGLIFTPFFLFIKGKYSIFILFEIVKMGFCFLTFKMLNGKISRAMLIALIALIFLDKEINLYREELTLGLVIMLFYWLYRSSSDYFYQAMLFFVILVPVHPVAALVHSLFYISFNLRNKEDIITHINFRRLVAYVIVGLLLYLYANFTSFGIATSVLGRQRVSVSHFPELLFFLKMSLPLVLALLIYISKVRENKIIISMSVAVLSILFLYTGGHYYYIYLIVFLILYLNRSIEQLNFNRIERFSLHFILFSSIYFTLGHRILVYSESTGYTKQIHAIFDEIENIDFSKTNGNVYISNNFVMPIIHKRNVRMTLYGRPYMSQGEYPINVGDEIYLVSKDELMQFKNSRFYSRCNVSEIIKPHQGILSISYFYQKRVNQYGLWRCKVIR